MPLRHDPPCRRTVEAVLSAGLTAQRSGSLPGWSQRFPRLMRWLRERWLAPLIDGLGDALPASQREGAALELVLAWALSQLRPDRAEGLSGIDEAAWIQRTSWRPMLAVACQFGLLPVPAFPTHYRRRPEETVVDNLCGLWSVGPSTFYRYLDKGKRLMVDLLAEGQPAGARLFALRESAQARLRSLPTPSIGWPAWHRAEADDALARGAIDSALWHALQAGDDETFIRTLQRFALACANVGDCDVLVERVLAHPLLPRQQFDLALARATVWRNRRADERELEALNLALRLAHGQAEPLLIGMAFGALGKFHESRDGDRAFACYEDSVAQLRQAQPEAGGVTAAAPEYASSLTRLAWLHVRRNDPRARTVLDRVQQLRQEATLPDEVLGELEQTWGEYWRRAGELRRALEHKHRALNLYERLGDKRSVLTTYLNLSLIYAEAREFGPALDYGQRVLQAAEGIAVEPEIIVGAHGNLGITYFFRGDYTRAIAAYREVLALADAAGLRSHLGTAHYNLAEAHYKRYQQSCDPEDERLGDEHAAAATRIGTADNAPALAEAGRALKLEVLGSSRSIDRLVPEEFAAHFAEMAEIQRLRSALAMPLPAVDQARIHVALARAYLTIASKERETAKALIEKHSLGDAFTAEFDALRQTFERELTREQRLTQIWGERSDDLLGSERRQSVLAHVLAQGSINKSTYAEVAAVSLATASKHLGLLAERGLLAQTGKGPSTRYLLPDTAH
jgi:tetratricopeptide (TPR) repeat protein